MKFTIGKKKQQVEQPTPLPVAAPAAQTNTPVAPLPVGAPKSQFRGANEEILYDLHGNPANNKVIKKSGERKSETAEKQLAKGIPSVMDIIAPSAIEVDYNFIRIGEKYFRTLFVSGYPRFVGANWLEPIINFDHTVVLTMI